MSSNLGLGGKGEKNKGKYKAIDINTLYKGKSVETQKSTVPRQHGLQSLGKVSTAARRMPPPANLPSLKSEHSGNDPSISLVPAGDQDGHRRKKKRRAVAVSRLCRSRSRPHQRHQHNPLSRPAPCLGAQVRGQVLEQCYCGGQYSRGLVSHQSPAFQEEFPSLAPEEKSKEVKKEEDSKDTQYGPGPSLRPQNVGSWREGGGRGVQQQSAKADEGSPPATSGPARPKHSPMAPRRQVALASRGPWGG